MDNDAPGTENIKIYNSIVQHDVNADGSGSTGIGRDKTIDADHLINITFANIITTDPSLGTLANNG